MVSDLLAVARSGWESIQERLFFLPPFPDRLVSQMDLAGTAMASKIAGGRVATVAIDRMAFLVPVAVGAQLSFYTQALDVGRSSIQMMIEVWSDDPLSGDWRKVTEAVLVFVAIDGSGRTRPVPPRRD